MKTKKIQKLFVCSTLILILSLVFSMVLFDNNASFAQATYQTPTPNSEGRILYTVQEGDTCTRIFLLTGVTIDQIITLNSLTADCNIYPGDQILLGIVEPTQTPDSNISPTPISVTPSPTPSPGVAELCVVLFDDLDGTGMRSETEFYLEGGQVSLNNRSGTFSKTGTTTGGDPELVEMLCFEDVPEGDYNITIGIPDGYNATTATNYALTLKAGNRAVLDFGAQTTSNVADDQEQNINKRSPLLGIAGGLVLLGGLGLGVYMWRSKRS